MIDLSEPYDFDNDADAATDSERRIAEERDRQPNWSFDSDDDTPPALSHPRTRDDLPAERSPRPKRDVPALQKARELPEGVPADEILCGDNLELIRRLPDKCVSLVITSPPYFRQRDYGGVMAF